MYRTFVPGTAGFYSIVLYCAIKLFIVHKNTRALIGIFFSLFGSAQVISKFSLRNMAKNSEKWQKNSKAKSIGTINAKVFQRT